MGVKAVIGLNQRHKPPNPEYIYMDDQDRVERVARAYTPDERRVADFLCERGVGGGDDPIGFILASYAYAIHQRNEAISALEGEKGQSYEQIVQLKTHLRALASFAKEMICNSETDMHESALRLGLLVRSAPDSALLVLSPWLNPIPEEEKGA